MFERVSDPAIHGYPTRMLTLAFLFMVVAALVADALGHHIERSCIYAATAISAFVEVLNVLARRNRAKWAPKLIAPQQQNQK